METFPITKNSCSLEDYLRTTLYNSKDPRGKNLSTQTEVIKSLSVQITEANNLKTVGTFAFKQLMVTKDMLKAGSNPKALAASVMKKFLLSGQFITDNNISKCSIAVAILAADVAFVVTTTAATAPATAGFSIYASYVLNGVRILSGVYSAYGACEPLIK